MATRVGINGFGRVGRAFTRYAAQRDGIDWARLGADVVIESTGKFRARDPEWGYSCRLADLTALVGSRL